MAICDRERAATEYALLTAAFGLTGVVIGARERLDRAERRLSVLLLAHSVPRHPGSAAPTIRSAG